MCFVLQLACLLAQIILLIRQPVRVLLVRPSHFVNGLPLQFLLPFDHLVQFFTNSQQGLEVFPRLLKFRNLLLQFFLRLVQCINGRLLGKGIVFSFDQHPVGGLHLGGRLRD